MRSVEIGISLNLPPHLIQTVRLTHALMELTDFDVHVSEAEASNYEYLSRYFPLDFSVYKEDAPPVLSDVSLEHDRPLTRVGKIERPLIIPHGIVGRCREKWAQARDTSIFFCGVMTPPRMRVVRAWLERHAGQRRGESFEELASRAEGLLQARVLASRRGRVFPGKCWDDSYHDAMAHSRFVLCPNGDFVWTYRFFEAVLCGAIPIVQAGHPAYAGFHYLSMDERLDRSAWQAEVVDHNFDLAAERLTVPLRELSAEIHAMGITGVPR